jgi:hypothetical protein
MRRIAAKQASTYLSSFESRTTTRRLGGNARRKLDEQRVIQLSSIGIAARRWTTVPERSTESSAFGSPKAQRTIEPKLHSFSVAYRQWFLWIGATRGLEVLL